jgi:hypothetical protein
VPNLLVVQPRDTLLGNAGDDNITGSQNADTIDGGINQDTINASGGNDSITTKDVLQDGRVFADTVDCGAGTDAITADLTDQNHLTNCENADISPGREGRHVRFGRLLRAHKGGKVPVALRCPRKASVACDGSLRLKVGLKTAGRSGHYRIRRGHRKTVILKLTGSFAKKVPFAGFMVASEKGRFGKKTTRLRVGVN